MEKKILRILSFLMIAVFAFGVMGLSISAEELDIPVIEEVAEEDMAEANAEEEVELFEVAEGSVAKIGETGYATINEAVSAAQNGDTITLLSDATFTSAITISGKQITIDGANFTLTDGVSGGSYTFNVNNGGVLFKNIKLC